MFLWLHRGEIHADGYDDFVAFREFRAQLTPLSGLYGFSGTITVKEEITNIQIEKVGMKKVSIPGQIASFTSTIGEVRDYRLLPAEVSEQRSFLQIIKDYTFHSSSMSARVKSDTIGFLGGSDLSIIKYAIHGDFHFSPGLINCDTTGIWQADVPSGKYAIIEAYSPYLLDYPYPFKSNYAITFTLNSDGMFDYEIGAKDIPGFSYTLPKPPESPL
jgi:hypothetical protein